jgi:hypothetical protein
MIVESTGAYSFHHDFHLACTSVARETRSLSISNKKLQRIY